MRSVVVLCVGLSLLGCKKIFLGPEPTKDSTVEVFDILWQDFKQHYGPFEQHGVDWDSLYRIYRPQVSPDISQDSLWSVVTTMLSNLHDDHVTLFDYKNSNWFSANKDGSSVLNLYVSEFVNHDLSYTLQTLNAHMNWAQVAGNQIGYIHVGSFDPGDYPIEKLDQLVSKVSHNQAIIVDVRDNWGGQVNYAWRLASWFSDNQDVVLYSETRNGPKYSDFTPKCALANSLLDHNLSDKLIILLTNRNTVSAGELFVLSMKTFKNVVQIGETTSGSFSMRSNERFLPNGWSYFYSIQRITLPNGTSPEGVGCIPDIWVDNKFEGYDAPYVDRILGAALNYLKECSL